MLAVANHALCGMHTALGLANTEPYLHRRIHSAESQKTLGAEHTWGPKNRIYPKGYRLRGFGWDWLASFSIQVDFAWTVGGREPVEKGATPL